MAPQGQGRGPRRGREALARRQGHLGLEPGWSPPYFLRRAARARPGPTSRSSWTAACRGTTSSRRLLEVDSVACGRTSARAFRRGQGAILSKDAPRHGLVGLPHGRRVESQRPASAPLLQPFVPYDTGSASTRAAVEPRIIPSSPSRPAKPFTGPLPRGYAPSSFAGGLTRSGRSPGVRGGRRRDASAPPPPPAGQRRRRAGELRPFPVAAPRYLTSGCRRRSFPEAPLPRQNSLRGWHWPDQTAGGTRGPAPPRASGAVAPPGPGLVMIVLAARTPESAVSCSEP